MQLPNLPRQWSELTVERYIEFKQLDPKQFGSVVDYRVAQLCVLLDTDTVSTDFDNIYDDDLEMIIDSIAFLKHEPKKSVTHCIDTCLLFKSFDTLTLGELIDLSVLMQDVYGNFTRIMAYIYRDFFVGEFQRKVWQPVTLIAFNEVEPIIAQTSIDKVYPAFRVYLEGIDKLLKDYSGLFDQDPEQVGDEDLKEMDAEERRIAEQENKYQKWAWEKSIFDLCDGDITKMDAVTELHATFVLNMMSMRKELGIVNGKYHQQS